MDTKPSSSPPDRWSLYADPSIFQVAVRTTDDGWIQMTLEVDPESTQGVGICGTRLLSQDVANGDESNKELASLSLQLKLEEIPHWIAILNEIYRRHHVEAVGKLKFEPDFEFPQREPLSSGLTHRKRSEGTRRRNRRGTGTRSWLCCRPRRSLQERRSMESARVRIILDSSMSITAERRGHSVRQILER